jgi:hypothetical protein
MFFTVVVISALSPTSWIFSFFIVSSFSHQVHLFLINDLVTGVFQDYFHNIFADIMNITFDCRQNDFSFTERILIAFILSEYFLITSKLACAAVAD